MCLRCRGSSQQLVVVDRVLLFKVFFSSRRRHTRCLSDWSSDVCSSDLFAQFTYAQTFETGTNVQAYLNSNNNFTNNSFNTFNPSINSILSFQFTQPLLRNGWLFANRAPLIIARRNLEQSKANFAAEVNNNVLQALAQYWSVV